ncbi:MAG: hypothetical protein ACT4NK_15800 [Limnobacter sp.]|jgi:hypothetical protein|uniref:hypothetical protein n=1 Tax=Limnobacter sp. TaxID=2003368 RepID=UPI00311F2217
MEHTPAAWKTKGSPIAQMAIGHNPSLAKGVPALKYFKCLKYMVLLKIRVYPWSVFSTPE